MTAFKIANDSLHVKIQSTKWQFWAKIEQFGSKYWGCSRHPSSYGPVSKMYPADYYNLTEFFEFSCESISVSCNFDSNTSEIQNILSNCSGQQGTILKLRQPWPMSANSALTLINLTIFFNPVN